MAKSGYYFESDFFPKFITSLHCHSIKTYMILCKLTLKFKIGFHKTSLNWIVPLIFNMGNPCSWFLMYPSLGCCGKKKTHIRYLIFCEFLSFFKTLWTSFCISIKSSFIFITAQDFFLWMHHIFVCLSFTADIWLLTSS